MREDAARIGRAKRGRMPGTSSRGSNPCPGASVANNTDYDLPVTGVSELKQKTATCGSVVIVSKCQVQIGANRVDGG